MMHTSSTGRMSAKVAVAKAAPVDTSWRSRTALACAILAMMILSVGAMNMDWSEGVAMTLGQLAGMAAPLIVLSLLGWAIAATVTRRR